MAVIGERRRTCALNLPLAEFGQEALVDRASADDVTVDWLVEVAARHYLAITDSGWRPAARVPRFVTTGGTPGYGIDVALVLTDYEWTRVGRAARTQGVTSERLLVHAALLYLADLASGGR